MRRNTATRELTGELFGLGQTRSKSEANAASAIIRRRARRHEHAPGPDPLLTLSLWFLNWDQSNFREIRCSEFASARPPPVEWDTDFDQTSHQESGQAEPIPEFESELNRD